MSDERAIPSEVRAALYARVSSERQAEKDLSIPAQLKALSQHAEKQGWKVVEQFVDEAESARTADRPEFQRMIALSFTTRRARRTLMVCGPRSLRTPSWNSTPRPWNGRRSGTFISLSTANGKCHAGSSWKRIVHARSCSPR